MWDSHDYAPDGTIYDMHGNQYPNVSQTTIPAQLIP